MRRARSKNRKSHGDSTLSGPAKYRVPWEETCGEPQVDGTYPEGTMNYLVTQRLLELNQSMRGYYGEVLTGVS